jgi:hypothetical protein
MRRSPSPPNPLSHKERGGTVRIRKRPIAFRTWVLSAPKPIDPRPACALAKSVQPAPAQAGTYVGVAGTSAEQRQRMS